MYICIYIYICVCVCINVHEKRTHDGVQALD